MQHEEWPHRDDTMANAAKCSSAAALAHSFVQPANIRRAPFYTNIEFLIRFQMHI